MPFHPQLTRRHWLAGLAMACLLTPESGFAQAATDQAQAFIEQTSRALVAVVNGPGGTAEKAASFEKIINTAVDVNTIGRFCLGRFWRTASPDEQKQYIELFHRVLVQNITGKVGEFQGVSIAILRATQREDGIAVSTTVTRPNEGPTKVDWLVSNESGAMRIVDVIAEGTSLRLTQRNDYASYLSRNNNSVTALIEALKKQASAS
jgi:phospholipid transport system substrate-binding protein